MNKEDFIHFPNKGHIYNIAICRRPTPGVHDTTGEQAKVTCPECKALLKAFNQGQAKAWQRLTGSRMKRANTNYTMESDT